MFAECAAAHLPAHLMRMPIWMQVKVILYNKILRTQKKKFWFCHCCDYYYFLILMRFLDFRL